MEAVPFPRSVHNSLINQFINFSIANSFKDPPCSMKYHIAKLCNFIISVKVWRLRFALYVHCTCIYLQLHATVYASWPSLFVWRFTQLSFITISFYAKKIDPRKLTKIIFCILFLVEPTKYRSSAISGHWFINLSYFLRMQAL